MNKNAVVMGLLFLVVFIVGFAFGRMTDGTSFASMGSSQNERAANNAEQAGSAGGGTTINTNNLTDGQTKMLESMGIDADNITITAEMVACAEAKLGSARVEEIKNGATPSFTEGASLMACYQ